VQRIVLGDARGDSVQGRARPLGAVAGLERGARAAPAVDQQSLRMQQVLASDRLLEYRTSSTAAVIEAKVEELITGSPRRDPEGAGHGWVGAPFESGYMRASWCRRWPTGAGRSSPASSSSSASTVRHQRAEPAAGRGRQVRSNGGTRRSSRPRSRPSGVAGRPRPGRRRAGHGRADQRRQDRRQPA